MSTRSGAHSDHIQGASAHPEGTTHPIPEATLQKTPPPGGIPLFLFLCSFCSAVGQTPHVTLLQVFKKCDF